MSEATKPFPREQISIPEFHARLKAQGVRNQDHCALVCPICGTVQSMASLMRAGAAKDLVERFIGFSCEGRVSNVGPWPQSTDKSPKARLRRKERGCNWTLGGLFQLHELEVVDDEGIVHPHFRVATPEQALALQAEFPVAADSGRDPTVKDEPSPQSP